LKPSFNHLTVRFADEEFDYVANSVSFYDIDHSKQIGGRVSPLCPKSNMNLSGCSSLSQAARLVSVRLRVELGRLSRSVVADRFEGPLLGLRGKRVRLDPDGERIAGFRADS
jgi:hypothetical protein